MYPRGTLWVKSKDHMGVSVLAIEQYPLEGEVLEMVEQGRSKSDKKMRVVIAFEHREGKVR